MKLRIKGNSVRLRLTQSEVTQIGQSFMVEDQITFSDDDIMVYRLQFSDDFKVVKQGNVITTLVPKDIGKKWVNSDDVGIEHTLESKNGNLNLLIEKDFKCLSDRAHEDETDLFDNPEISSR